MLTYGGYPLRPATPELAAWISSSIPPHRVFSFHRHPRLSSAIFDPRTHLERFLSTPIQMNTLTNPWGASRWGHAAFIVDGDTLDALRAASYADGGYLSRPLVISDGVGGTITNDMYMLPAVPLTLAPLSANDIASRVHLMVLVDVRYFWWEVAANLTVTENTTTWATLIAAIGTALGVTIEHDAVPAAYLKPGVGLAAKHEHLPMVLDLLAASIGMRFVRTFDGEFKLLSAATSIASMTADVATAYPISGGAMSLGVVDA